MSNPWRRNRYSRRQFLHVGAASLLGVSLVDQLHRRARCEELKRAAAKNCIQIWLAGGPATIDMWDMKSSAPAGIRGEFRPVATSADGVQICEHLSQLASVMQHCTLVRSVRHSLPDHEPGTQLMLSGRAPNPVLDYPGVGSIAGALLPSHSGVPKYMALGSEAPGPGGFLGAAEEPFRIRESDLSGGKRIAAPVELPDGFSIDDLARRESLLQYFDDQFATYDEAPLARHLSAFQQQALDILRSNKTRRALDLESESEASRMRYGAGWLGQALLAARRLVEAGVGFVTVGFGGWDTHANNFADLRTALLPQLDQALAALIGDLNERGMLDETLIYCAGEFGRTPHINGQAGRDHWARAMTVLLAGGGLKRGYAHGSTDEHGLEVATDPCSPADVNATLLAQLGVNADTMLYTSSGRPLAAWGDGQPLTGLTDS